MPLNSELSAVPVLSAVEEGFAYVDTSTPLVLRCRAGDRRAQAELYRLYCRAMLNVSFRITNSQEEAEDVLQEAFVSAFRDIGNYKGESSFGAWLKRIVINRSLNRVQQRRLDVVRLDDTNGRDWADDDEAAEGAGAWSWLREHDGDDQDRRIRQVQQALHLLPDGYRMVLTLYLLEGYDHAEIGEILGISESTSKSQYSRARKRLLELVLARQPTLRSV
jgi:RNA polymerase sigma factor (sigma-70 family)